MISNRIDLTEHNDFSQPRNTPILTGIYVDEEMMTPEQYETVVHWRRIFGKRRPDNQKDFVFRRDEMSRRNFNNHCRRCGIDVRIPWKLINGLCGKCNERVYDDNEVLPWESAHESWGERMSDNMRNLFNLR